MGTAGAVKLSLGASVLALAVLSSHASAQPVGLPEGRVEAARFQLEASDGFVADVDAAAGRVYLTLTRTLKHRREIAQYLVDGEVSTRGIKADLGSLGSIDVTFHPTGTTEGLAPPEGCDGYYVKGKTGTFVGTIRFRGEEGYVRINAKRAKGKAAASSRWGCDHTEGSARRQERPLRRSSTQEREEGAEARETDISSPIVRGSCSSAP
jgi:hypothetical protein